MLITIDTDKVAKRMDETFMQTLKEITTDGYTEEIENLVREKLRKALETATEEVYVEAIARGYSDQLINQIFVGKD